MAQINNLFILKKIITDTNVIMKAAGLAPAANIAKINNKEANS